MSSKNLGKCTLVGMLALFTITSAHAQSVGKMIVEVPFAYSVYDQVFPAGEYEVGTTINGLVTIRNHDSSATANVLGHHVQSYKDWNRSRLLFKRYGNTYFLSQIWTPGRDIGVELQQSKAERELIARTARTVELTARR